MAITLVQSTEATATQQGSGALSISANFGSNTAANNLLIAVAKGYASGGSITSATMTTAGITWTKAEQLSNSTYCSIWYAVPSTIVSSATSNTFSDSTSQGYIGMLSIYEFHTTTGTWSQDTNGGVGSNSSGTTPNPGAITCSASAELIIGSFFGYYTAAYTNPAVNASFTAGQLYAPAVFSIFSPSDEFSAVDEYLLSSASGSNATTFGAASQSLTGWTAVAAAFTTVTVTPTVTSCSPAQGPLTGAGEVCTVTGTGFINTGTTTIQFGANAATNVTYVNSTTMTCTPPASTTGTGLVNVVLTNNNGTGTGTNAFTYSYIAYIGGATNAAGTVAYTPIVGNLIIAAGASGGVKDNNNNALTQLNFIGALYYYYGYAEAGATSYTDAGGGALVIAEYAGSGTAVVNTSNQTTTSSVSSTTPSISLTTTETNDFIVAVILGSHSMSANTGFIRQILGGTNAIVDNTAAGSGILVTDSTTQTAGAFDAIAVEIISTYTAPLGTSQLAMGMCGTK